MDSEARGYNIVGCPAEQCERMHCFAGNSLFCQAHAFEGWTPTSNPSPNYHLNVLFVTISYPAWFCLQISFPAIFFTMLVGILNRGSFIINALLPGTSKAFTLSVFLPGACVLVLLPGTQHLQWSSDIKPLSAGHSKSAHTLIFFIWSVFH